MRRVLSALVLAAAVAAPGTAPASAEIPPPCDMVGCPDIGCGICEPPYVGCWRTDDMIICL